MKFAINTEVSQEGVILFLFGNFDYSVKEEFLKAMEKHKTSQQRLFLDMQNVSFIDSAGIGVLAAFVKKYKELNNGMDLKIVNPRGQVRETFKLTNFSEMVSVVDSDPQYANFTSIAGS